jgi:chromosome segregation ATPase
LVVTATRKRNELKVIEDKITNKTQAKEEIDNEMRRVERELVEILLEQQKMVLSLTS